MTEKRVQFSNIVQNQLPAYVRTDFPLISDFLKQYYLAQEYQSGPIDLIQNIDQYVKVDDITNLTESVVLENTIGVENTSIEVDMVESEIGTNGFPDSYGLIKIGDEIITYTSKTATSFEGCIRGFVGTTDYKSSLTPDQLVFSTSKAAIHNKGDVITNLSTLFLKEFLVKTKFQLIPGFEGRSLSTDLNQNVFIKQAKDFYLSKGTDRSFEILFKALYDEDVSVIKPKDRLFTPSNAEYRITKDIVVESVTGDPIDLTEATLYQDAYEDIPDGYAPITSVEQLAVGAGKTFYKLSIDSGYNRDLRVDGAIYGDFAVHAKSKTIGRVTPGTTVIDVDSTISFPSSGEIYVNYEDETVGVVSYTSTSVNQFYGCSNIAGNILDGTVVGINTYAYGLSSKDGSEVKVRIASVLENASFPSDTSGHSKNETANIKTLGVNDTTFKYRNWVYNTAPIYQIKTLELIDSSNYTYKITLDTEHYFNLGDAAQIITAGVQQAESTTTKIVDITSSKSFTIQGQGVLPLEQTYNIKRTLSRGASNPFPNVSEYTTNIQNVYKDDDKTLIASPSIPSYNSQPLNASNRSISFQGTFSGDTFNITSLSNGTIVDDHGFYTGDEVYYTPEIVSTTTINPQTGTAGITTSVNFLLPAEGLYFINRVDNRNVQFAVSRSDIYNNVFISIPEKTVTNQVVEPYKFRKKVLESQKILRKIEPSVDDGIKTPTSPGFTGILKNGVEILNYKSEDIINYGKIEKFDVLATGLDYDIINPPSLKIVDQVGIGATGFLGVSGTLQEIRITDRGSSYERAPRVTITGGGGSGAKAYPIMKDAIHEVPFTAQVLENKEYVGLGATNSTIGFTTNHMLHNGEKVIYITNGEQAIGGLSTNTVYYAGLKNDRKIALYNKYADARTGINTVTLTDYGRGTQYIRSYNKRLVVDSFTIDNSGFEYKNNKTSTLPTGISTATDEITINNHNYESGDTIVYNTQGTSIGGLNDGNSYVVKKVDDNRFKLSSLGSSFQPLVHFNRKDYIDLTTVGVGTHLFNYPPIDVHISDDAELIQGRKYPISIDPIFRGVVTSLNLSDNGVGYGSSEIVNFDRQPLVILEGVSAAQITPIVTAGKVVEVLVNYQGSGYNASPNILLYGTGTGCDLVPVVTDGKITEVRVMNQGSGYTQNTTTAAIVSPGRGAAFKANIQNWRVNLVKKNEHTFTTDDGFITTPRNVKFGLQYSHLYAPRKLREQSYSIDSDGKVLYGQPDLKIINGEEASSIYHSPIIGWAYDGNPIYGPYGYTSQTGGSIGQLKSGYTIKLDSNRPPLNLFPEGFFIEDYSYTRVDDALILDENNGRYCITPDFPNGTYAYFTTIGTLIDSDGPFEGYKNPEFPYLIGDRFNSTINDFNIAIDSNQDTVGLNTSNWLRNTAPYNLIDGTLNYEYLAIPDNLSQTADVNSVTPGGVERVGIITGGDYYQVGESVIFETSSTQGSGANAKVSRIEGAELESISVGSSTIKNVEIYPFNDGTYEVVAEHPHNFDLNDTVMVSGLSSTSTQIDGAYKIGITTNNYSLSGFSTESTGIGNIAATGIVTYFAVEGNIVSRPNDIYEIGNERIKVLNIEPTKRRIRFLRGQDGTAGSAHTVTTTIFDQQRRFTINAGFNTSDNARVNTEIYFNPLESVSVGTGAGTTITFSNPGAGITDLFVPSKAIYIPNHKLETGDKLTYYTNTGTGISVRYNESSPIVSLVSGQTLYAAKITPDLVGVSTVVVGMGTTGTFVGIAQTNKDSSTLFFSGIGTGVYQSFKTNYEPITGIVKRNLVTVSTGDTHGLSSGDYVTIDVNPSIASTYIVKYNDYNRRIVINPRDFAIADVDIVTNSITILEHGYFTGQKVIHTADTPSTGLVDNGMYYVVVIDDDTIRLSESHYFSTLWKPYVIDISSASAGTISPINPAISAYKNSTVEFNLSDPSLSYTKFTTLYSAFELNFYTDENMNNKWEKSDNSSTFAVNSIGKSGVSADAKVTLRADNDTPSTLYYKFSPIFESDLPVYKEGIVIDKEVVPNNQVETKDSLFDGTQQVTVGIGSTNTFTYTISVDPERSSYISSTSLLDYTTDSKTAVGPISEIDILQSGVNYYSLPGISTVNTLFGLNAILEPFSSTIGNIKDVKLNNIGFNFPSDKTLKPSLSLPQVLRMDTLQAIEHIGVTSVGNGYAGAPSLIAFDGKTGKQVAGLDVSYDLKSQTVEILSNTDGVNNVPPTILPVRNSNGVGISTINFNTTTKDVTISLEVGFGTDDSFPFAYGDKVMIEGVSVGVNSTGKGYNSDSYNYQLFSILGVSQNPGGIATVRYNMSEHFSGSDTPGNIDVFNSAGRIIPEKDFPSFNVKLKSKEYYVGETVTSPSATGTVESWNSNNGILNVTSHNDFVVGEVVKGSSSDSQGIASSVTAYDSSLNLNYYSIVKNGWQTDSGMLNDNIQRVQDNDYYQRFAYSLKTTVPYSTWEDVVGALNHTLGFRKFGDLQAESSNVGEYGLIGSSEDKQANASESTMPVIPVEPMVDRLVDVIGYANLNTVQDFEIGTENSLHINSKLLSTELTLSGARVLTDYYESIGNRVLSIDDISSQFNSNPRTATYSVVTSFDLADIRSQKYITYVKDRRFYGTRQLMIVDLVHDNYIGYLNQYGRLENIYDLGSFDFNILGSQGQLLFYPNKYQVNDFDITCLSYNINDNLLSIGSSVFGAAAEVKTSSVEIPANTPTTIVSLASTYRSAKVLVSLTADSTKIDAGGEFEFDELNIIHDGTNVDIVEYPQLITSPSLENPIPGFGTYSGYIDGSLIKIDFHPHNSTAGVGTTSIVNTIQVAISSETSTGIGTFDMKHAKLEGRSTSISASGSPTENVIGSYINDYDAAYFVVQISDTTNNNYQISEVITIDDYDSSDGSGDTYNAEYGIVETVTGLGTIGTRITGAGAGNDAVVELVYTPLPNIDAHVNVFMNALREQDDTRDIVSLNNATIQTEFNEYFGTERDIKRAFELKHQTNTIFDRSFDGSSTDVVDLTKDTIQMANHFFVTGEEIQYIHAGAGSSQAIGIAATDGFVGVGTTDKLPSTVFAIKMSEDKIKIAETAQKALMGIVNNVDFTSVGIGTSHRFVSTKQNSKVLVTLDNIIQSPVVSTAVTTHLDDQVFTTSDIIQFAGITSFFGGDLIKIGNEIMKIEGIGIGNSTGIRVRRSWLGTSLAGYGTGDVVTKVIGNYNIVENTLNFVEAPYGNVPIGSTTNPPDDRDWTGISTGSHFQGRSFMRSGIPNSPTDTYARNYIFDDISSGFTGTVRDFVLTSAGSTVTGIENDNAIILINDVFQGPGRGSDYELEESGSTGITTISFTGTASSIASDVNTSNLPVGGVIVSVGSTEGFGYQPLVAAGGTAVVSTGGTISLVSIGNSGSGYRSGSQIPIVGIQTQDLSGTTVIGIGTAIVEGGHVTGIAVTNTTVIYKPRDIQNVGYNSITGITKITTATPHNLNLGSDVVVSGIAFTCTYSPAKDISTVSYNNANGTMTVTTSSAHGFSIGKDVILTGLAMTCGLDNGASDHYYPRNRDRVYDTAISITGTSSTSITVNVTSAGLSDQYTHQFDSATSGAVITGGNYGHQFVGSSPNAVTVTGWTTAFTPSNAVYNPVNGELVITSTAHGLSTSNTVSVTTDGITFTCDMDSHSTNHSYPRTTDPIAGIATAVTAVSSDTFTINVGSSPIVNFNVTDANYNAGSGELELIIGSHSLTSGSSIKLKKESLGFKCSKDSYATVHKYPRGGDPGYDGVKVIGVNSPTKFDVNVGVSTVPTFYKSGGTVQGVIIAPRGDDPAASQTDVLQVIDDYSFLINSGISTRRHFYARGGTVSIPMEVVIDAPLGYENIPLEYSSVSSGIGSNATVNVVVGQDSSVIDFRIDNSGYGYGNGQILTLPIGGTTGIPTTSGYSINEFQLTIDTVFTDEFTGWSMGMLQTLDDISYLFDGNRLTFPLQESRNPVSIRAGKGSPINIQDTLLIFVNDVLQVPGKGYKFDGGSIITFTEAPKEKDTCKIVFYKGSGDQDVKFRDVVESVKPGDILTPSAYDPLPGYLQEEDRTVTKIKSTNTVDTMPYYGPGITGDPNLEKPVVWTRQTEDMILNGKPLGKDRSLYEPRINPSAFVIKSVGVTTTQLFVDNVRPFFDSKNESDSNLSFQNKITLTSQDSKVGASATCIVSAGGSITSINILDGGSGYNSVPSVVVSNPVGYGSTATATATVSAAGTVTGVVVSFAGTGYVDSAQVLIQPPTLVSETNNVDSYIGDYGVVVGFGTTTQSLIDKMIMDLYIPTYSDMRDEDLVGTAVTISSLDVGDYFMVYASNAGIGSTSITSKDINNNVIGVGTQFIDNIYQVSASTIQQRDVVGVGNTYIRRVYANISGLSTVTFGSSNLTFDSTNFTFDNDGEGAGSGFVGVMTASNFFGNFSWGKITLVGRSENSEYSTYPDNGISGISTWPVVQRTNHLKSVNYII
jgi:hypothetical protein